MNFTKICQDLIEAELQQLVITSNLYHNHCSYIRQALVADSGRILYGLVERLKNGSCDDVKLYIEENLKVPLGIQQRCYQCICKLLREDHSVYHWNSDSVINTNSNAKQLLLQWKAGHISQSQYFTLINSGIDQGLLSVTMAQSLFNVALREGGYSTDKPNFQQLFSYRRTVDAAICSIDNITNILSHDNELTLYSRSNTVSLLCNGEHLECNTSLHRPPNASPCVSSDLMYWSHEGTQPGLTLVGSLNDNSVTSHDRLHLFIGDTITLSNGILDIDYVISVDAIQIDDNLPSDGSSAMTYVVFLVDGRIYQKSRSNNGCCSPSECDGASELGGKDNSVNDSDGSDSEGHPRAANVEQVRKQYFCVLAVIYGGLVKVIQDIAIHDVIFKDQIPIQVRCVSQNLVIINGTHGLLATLSFIRGCGLNLLPADSSSIHFNHDTCQLTHSADVTVSAVAFNTEHRLLCSGDSSGVICLWQYTQSGHAHLLAAPIQFESIGKICNLQFSPSGMHIAVALWDRLMLLVVSSTLQVKECEVDMQYCLYVRSNLDTTMNNIAAKYSVEFGSQYIRVWRIINQPTDEVIVNGNVRVTTWVHPISDQYESRCRSNDSTSSSSIGITPTLTCSSLEQSTHQHTPSLETARDSEPMQVDSLETVYHNGNTINNENTSMSFIDNEFVMVYQSTYINVDTSQHSTNNNMVTTPVSSTFVNSSHKIPSLHEIYRPLRGEVMYEQNNKFLSIMNNSFVHDNSDKFIRLKLLLVVYCACYQFPTVGLLSAALDISIKDTTSLINGFMSDLVNTVSSDSSVIVTLKPSTNGINKWLCSTNYNRINQSFWLDVSIGHNMLCALYLRHCGNKSVAMEHPWQEYLRTYGACHLRRCSRGLRLLTSNFRKIDETANIKYNLPYQIGYIVGLQEIYARRVGLGGKIPYELGELSQLRVLSMGNNHLRGELPASLGELKHLQRIVLHQNNLQGHVPPSLGTLGCIVNLAGNSKLEHGDDVPVMEREALMELFHSTKGPKWNNKTLWCSHHPVAKWYKVGVLTSHVHSIVMSSNGMEGKLPSSIGNLSYLRMIELATMPGLISNIPKELCNLTTLRRLCICRCGLTGKIPSEIGQLVALEELQLFGNQLTGIIPPSVSNLVNLKLLSFGEYTGGNSFTPAPLPSCLSALVNLEALFMANCNLKGVLPDWIGNLKELRQLDLQRNNFCGSLPSTVGELTNLLYLNIKDNEHLTGKLPIRELMSLTKLNRLSLVHCSFPDADADIEILRNHLPRCKIWV